MVRHGLTWAALACTAFMALSPELTAADGRTTAQLPSYTRPVTTAASASPGKTQAQQTGIFRRRGRAYSSSSTYSRPYTAYPYSAYRGYGYGYRGLGYPYGGFGPYGGYGYGYGGFGPYGYNMGPYGYRSGIGIGIGF